MRRILVVAFAACALAIIPRGGAAQTAQKISIQGSGLFAGLFGTAFDEIKDGIGGELQIRYTPGKWSFGGGLQYTVHNFSDDVKDVFPKAKLAGVFFEPRRVFDAGSERYAPYLSARLAFSQMNIELEQQYKDAGLTVGKPTGPTINGGGGVLIRLNGRTNIDVGATYGYTKFKATSVTIPGESEPLRLDLGDGTNIVLRVGFAFGIGG
jgi:hypothetical protein